MLNEETTMKKLRIRLGALEVEAVGVPPWLFAMMISGPELYPHLSALTGA
jgi:hypothetical protein